MESNTFTTSIDVEQMRVKKNRLNKVKDACLLFGYLFLAFCGIMFIFSLDMLNIHAQSKYNEAVKEGKDLLDMYVNHTNSEEELVYGTRDKDLDLNNNSSTRDLDLNNNEDEGTRSLNLDFEITAIIVMAVILLVIIFVLLIFTLC